MKLFGFYLVNMPKPYSDDLRWRIVWQKLLYNRSTRRIASDLFISPKTVQRVFRIFLNTGNVCPVQKFGRPLGTTTLYQHEELVICEMILSKPTIRLKEIAYEFQSKLGTHFSIPSLCAAVRRLGFSRKKVNNFFSYFTI